MAELIRQNFDAYWIDATDALVELAQSIHPELVGRVEKGVFPDFSPPFSGEYDGVLMLSIFI